MLVLLLLFCKTFVLRRRRRRYGRRRHEISMQAQEAELEHDPHDGSLTNDQSFGCKLLRRLSPQPSSKSISSRVRKVLFEKERKPERARAGEWVCERTITQASFLFESFVFARERERERALRTAVVVAASFAIDLLFNYNCLLHCVLNLLAARKK